MPWLPLRGSGPGNEAWEVSESSEEAGGQELQPHYGKEQGQAGEADQIGRTNPSGLEAAELRGHRESS